MGVKHGSVAVSVVALLAIGLGFAGVSTAKTIRGTQKADRLVGTAKADRIFGRGGNDRILGRRGNDRLFGGPGADRIFGGPGGDRLVGGPGRDRLFGGPGRDRLFGGGGRDVLRGGPGNDILRGGGGPDLLVGGPGVNRLFGGPGNDVLNAANNRRDAVIDGGLGTDTCYIDIALELAIVRNCDRVLQGNPPGGAPAPGDGLRVISATGLTCGTSLPLCPFTISGDGADALVGLVTGGGGVTLGVGAGVSISGSSWTATGLYGCTADGFLRVMIGEKSVDVPITCTA